MELRVLGVFLCQSTSTTQDLTSFENNRLGVVDGVCIKDILLNMRNLGIKEWHRREKEKEEYRTLCDAHIGIGSSDSNYRDVDKFLFDHQELIDRKK